MNEMQQALRIFDAQNDALRDSEERFRTVLDLSSDWYWEQDAEFRFTDFMGGVFERTGIDVKEHLGRTRWEAGGLPLDATSWAKHRALLAARGSFRDFVYSARNAQGEMRFVCASGQPIFSAEGRFIGYRGVAKDVTERVQAQRRLTLEHAVAGMLAECHDMDEAAPQVLRKVCEVLGWSCGLYWRWEPQAGLLHCHHVWGHPAPAIQAFLQAAFDISPNPPAMAELCRRAWFEGKPVWMAELAREPDLRRAAAAVAAGLHSALAFPIIARTGQMGVMEFFHADPQPPEGGLLEGMSCIGQQLGQFCQRTETERALREIGERFQGLTELSSDWYWEQDEAYRFVLWGGGNGTETFLCVHGKCMWELAHEGVSETAWAQHRALLAARAPFHGFVLERADDQGGKRFLSFSGRPFYDDNGNFEGYRGIAKDMTEQLLADRAIRASEARFRDLIELSSDWYWEQDKDYRFTMITGSIRTQTGLDPETVIGKARWEVPESEPSAAEWEQHRALLNARREFRDFTYAVKANNGERRHVRISGKPIFDDSGAFQGYRGVGNDVTESRRSEERIQYLAYHDPLTALPNRAMFGRTLAHAVEQARRHGQRIAVLFIDLDRFKNINDTLGHEAGDMLLQETGQRLQQTLRQSDSVARLGGDEFVVLLEQVEHTEHVASVARKLMTAIIKPYYLLGQEFRITASIGVSLYPNDGEDDQTLMKNADIAMYLAKEQGKNNYQFYSQRINAHSFERLAMESSLRRALERNEFHLHYQAKINLSTRQITGMEALLRWQHPDLGMVSPARFIPIAEETGLIVPIGRWVLQTACAQNRAWQGAGMPRLRMAVNLSPRQFADDNLPRDVKHVLRETGMDADLLELEITESMVMYNHERAIRQLREFRRMGVHLAIDDFGTGYSSLSSLKHFPVDTIKIDRSFINEIPNNNEDIGITEAIIAMGKTLGMTVVAEGVETEEQLDFLRGRSCDEMQGFYFSKPLSNDAFMQLVRDNVDTHRHQ